MQKEKSGLVFFYVLLSLGTIQLGECTFFEETLNACNHRFFRNF